MKINLEELRKDLKVYEKIFIKSLRQYYGQSFNQIMKESLRNKSKSELINNILISPLKYLKDPQKWISSLAILALKHSIEGIENINQSTFIVCGDLKGIIFKQFFWRIRKNDH